MCLLFRSTDTYCPSVANYANCICGVQAHLNRVNFAHKNLFEMESLLGQIHEINFYIFIANKAAFGAIKENAPIGNRWCALRSIAVLLSKYFIDFPKRFK